MMLSTLIRKSGLITRTAIFHKNDRGFSLTEVIAAIAVSTIMVAMAVVAILAFYGKFRELSYFAHLQQDAFDTLEAIKYGYPFQAVNEYIFLGIANARSVTLQGPGGGWGTVFDSITCIPSREAEGHTYDYVRYYLDPRQGAIMMQGLYGVTFRQEQIFPTRNDDLITVTSFRIRSLTGFENPAVVAIELEAEIEISEDNVKKVHYTTNVALSR